MVSRANNHTGDYGTLGMDLTTRRVRDAGLLQAGVGQSLAEAREAKFLETTEARVALISVASTFPDHSRAGRTRGDIPARPGLNPLRFSTTYVVPRERLESLRSMMQELGMDPPATGDGLSFRGNRFVVGDAPAVRTEANPEDVREIGAVVANASRLADYTIVTIHAHEGDGDRFVPAQFLVEFAHAMVDADADIFVGHGPHVVRGINSGTASRSSIAWRTSCSRTKRCCAYRARTTSRTIWTAMPTSPTSTIAGTTTTREGFRRSARSGSRWSRWPSGKRGDWWI